MPHRTLGVYLTLSIFLCFRPACAQQDPALYLGAGRMLQAAPPRQLSLNAHVGGFLFQPGGLSIAYVGVHDDGGKRTVAVRLVGARAQDSPDAQTLFRVMGRVPASSKPGALAQENTDSIIDSVDLIGWTLDARRLLVQEVEENDSASDMGDGFTLTTKYYSVDVGTVPFRVRPVPAPELPGMTRALPHTAWSPNHQRLLMTADGTRWDDQNHPKPLRAAAIYDPERDQMLPVTIPDSLRIIAWLDDEHILFVHDPDETPLLSHDLATGTDTEVPEEMLSQIPQPALFAPPGLTLETQPQTLPDTQKVAETPANSIWIRRAAAPRALSAVAVSVTPGPDDPQAAWSPTGKSVAFLAHGDLFVADLTPREATTAEKLAAGEKLDCDEEKQVIMSHLKQFGLGVAQYTQDNDEKFPSADGWHDAVYPYIKSEEIFKFAGVPIVYHAPANLSLASIDSPADTVLATSDTPCAHIVLFADGHVKAFDIAAKQMPPGQ